MKHRGVALVGLLAMVPIALGLVRNTLTLSAAATRALVLLVILWVIEAVVLPLGQMALHTPKRRESD